ncbi:hypothetical protein DINM_002287 [Dirofilaria immitis]|nr:hypothetical protein [Dirofilaria immitis]
MSAMFASMTCKVKPNYISYFFHHSYLGEFLSNDGTTKFTILSAVKSQESIASFILVPHGLSPDDAERVIIPAVNSGPQPPFPCLVAGLGTYEHGQTFTKEHFHYKCNNGTAEGMRDPEISDKCYCNNYYFYLAACVADDKSVIHIGRMFIRGKSTCYDNGIHYDIGEHFRNGSFVLICQRTVLQLKNMFHKRQCHWLFLRNALQRKDDNIPVMRCYARNTDITIPIGTERILDHYLHKCELLDRGRVRYTANCIIPSFYRRNHRGCFDFNFTVIGCKKDNEFFNEGQIWTSEHIRYQCTSHGIVRVLGCVDDNGLFVELGRDILMHNIVHRCYRIDKTTVYHRFACVGRTLVECILTPPLQRPRPVSKT